MGGFCPFVELYREGSAPAACAAGLFIILHNDLLSAGCGHIVSLYSRSREKVVFASLPKYQFVVNITLGEYETCLLGVTKGHGIYIWSKSKIVHIIYTWYIQSTLGSSQK